MSEYFSAINGVKQGAVLSPVLFCVYIDNLLLLLSKTGTGCYIGPNFIGAVIPKSRRTLFEHLDGTIFTIDNKPISLVKSFSHLGHIITSELTDDDDIAKRCGDFIGQVNNTVCYFRKLDSFVQNRLFRSYCTSYYGCELWLLSN